MKENIKILIEQRKRANVFKDLLFSKPGDTKFPYRGSDCLRKFSLEAGVENPQALTSTKLRKQLATLAQILNLSESSQDILATFQGHDIRVHRQFYRLPDDTMQLAKVSKILHSLNNGTIAKYQGKDFDEIQLEAKEAVESESDSEAELNESVYGIAEEEREEGKDIKIGSSKKQTTEEYMTRKPERVPNICPRHQWTKDEKAALLRNFKQAISLQKTPGQLDCLNAIRKEPCLATFNWKQVKFAVKNLITSKKDN
ncbi:uncharacterized protein LOC133199782 [Saccostrea echinata]|uniref:uncharacterized protein LOC133199782 n=1 Tax=Saccostrea echinata TaxID=191078 RepID=UPI002A7F1F91|nr:uncharacterized protein LOC133199782 [Saccostrea echinata]